MMIWDDLGFGDDLRLSFSEGCPGLKYSTTPDLGNIVAPCSPPHFLLLRIQRARPVGRRLSNCQVRATTGYCSSPALDWPGFCFSALRGVSQPFRPSPNVNFCTLVFEIKKLVGGLGNYCRIRKCRISGMMKAKFLEDGVDFFNFWSEGSQICLLPLEGYQRILEELLRKRLEHSRSPLCFSTQGVARSPGR